jgi:hypothetical protein
MELQLEKRVLTQGIDLSYCVNYRTLEEQLYGLCSDYQRVITYDLEDLILSL